MTETSTEIDGLVSEVLDPGADLAAFATQSFIALGGDSLSAMRLAALAERRFGLRVAVKSLLGDMPLARVLAEAIPAGEATGKDGRAGPTEPARAQRGMWITEAITGGSPYNLVFLCLVTRGQLEPDPLERAIADVTARHEGLRTVFTERDGDIARVVLPAFAPKLARAEYHGQEDGFKAHARDRAREFGGEPFSMSQEPPLRFLLLSHVSGRQVLVVAAHHMLLDGQAAGLLLREIFLGYDRRVRGETSENRSPAIPFEALLLRQEAARASGSWNRRVASWRERLADVPTVLELPADRVRPLVHDAEGTRIPVTIGRSTSIALPERARELGITLCAFLLGAFGLTLSRWTGSRRFLIGVPFLGRDTPELMNLIAYVGNLVPVLIEVDDDATAGGYLRSVHDSLLASIEAGDLPFEELVSRLSLERPASCHPLVQVAFGLHDQLIPDRIVTDSCEIRVEESHGGGSQFDLSLMLGSTEPSVRGYAEYATSVWSAAEAAGFVEDFQAAVAELIDATAVGAAPASLEDVRCVAPRRRAFLDAVNETRREFPATSLDTLFRETARRWPDAVAVRDELTELTYAGLAEAAAEQARSLRAAGVRPGDTVIIGTERSVAEAVAVLGTVLAGAAYVGVDLTQPRAHTAVILAKAAPAAAIAGSDAAPVLGGFGLTVVPAWDASRASDGRSSDLPAESADPARLAYVAFTSGSTGQPKGVAVPHRAVIRLVHEAGYVRLGPGERVLRLSPLAFDASTLELWGALLTGSTLEVCPPGLLSPSDLGSVLVGRGVTVAWLTAGLFRLVEEFAPESLRGLRQLLTGGDVVPHEHAARALAHSPGLVITNGYGPTENTTFTATHSVTRPEDIDGPLPIGIPVPGTRVYVLDDHGRRVPPGAVGELYAGGEGLADGYIGDEAETMRRFGLFSAEIAERLYRTGDLVRLDAGGRLRFLGRADDQVKIRGYRIELTAIRDTLVTCPGVQDAVVTVTDSRSAAKRLVAAVVREPGATLTPAALRDRLTQKLPSYMMPALWAIVDSFPVTPNGKTDRQALVARAVPAGRRAGEPQPAQDPALARVMPLFAEAIGDESAQLSADSDFFKSGGNSLAAVQLIGMTTKRLGASVRLRDFLLAPTPAGLSTLVEKAESARKAAGAGS